MPSDAKILIVDDHEDTLYALESALAPLGYRLGRATSGDEALKQVLRGQVGLLLLDVRMPGVSGLDVVRYMRRLEQTQHIPVILLTGFGPDQELTAAAFGLGVADLVMKPIDPWALRTKVRYLYDAYRRQRALEQENRELRALVKGHEPPGPAPRPALPHPEAHAEAHPEVHAEAHPEVHAEAHPGAHPELQVDAHPDARPELHVDAHPQVDADARPDARVPPQRDAEEARSAPEQTAPSAQDRT